MAAAAKKKQELSDIIEETESGVPLKTVLRNRGYNETEIAFFLESILEGPSPSPSQRPN